MSSFKARARALDMLGRQQIAGVPTAISELFKNAFDAYADNVVADYFKNSGLLVIRDDGTGMSLEDFENRWLTIGTESKTGGRFGLGNINPPEGKSVRPVTGEKGIGRLAIAMLGSQVLLITRAQRDNCGFVCCFINWRLFELPGLNLDDIHIPVREFGEFPSNIQINEMLDSFTDNIGTLYGRAEESELESIRSEINSFREKIDIEKMESVLGQPCRFDNGSAGTRFYIYPSNPIIVSDLEYDAPNDDAPELNKMLIGFTDSTIPGHGKVPLNTSFRYHKHPEYYEDVISDSNFFTPDEFEKAEHLFTGRFDEYGQFTGTVKIFGRKQASDYVVPWAKSRGRPVGCGPFEMTVMTVQGSRRESLLDEETHARLTEKLYRYGGLYIYRDGIRVLPYGNNKHDFLGIEMRRSKSAGYYFWSYRRLLGAVRLTGAENGNLKEKAGREGFQETKAFRDMRDILVNFFLQTARDFFAKKGEYSEYFMKVRDDNIKRDELLRREEKKKKKKKEEFEIRLRVILAAIESGEHGKKYAAVIGNLNGALSYADGADDKESAALRLVTAEKEAFRSLSGIKEELSISVPRGISLKKETDTDYKRYKDIFSGLEENFFRPAYREIETMISAKSRDARIEIDRRLRIEESLNRLSGDAKKQVSEKTGETRETLGTVSEKVTASTRDSLLSLENVIKNITASLARTDFKDMNDEDIFSWRMEAENRILSVAESGKKELETIKALLDNVSWEKDEEGNIVSYIDVLEAKDSKIGELEEKSDLDSDLAQMGMAVHVINHEFDASIRTVRENLRRLKAWADVNDGLQNVYSGIKNSFDHLDSYLSLFTPLNRRLQRKSAEIKGHEIEEFIYKLFGERFRRHNIDIKSSVAFRQSVVNTFPSSIYPVFVNIIDNATYWLKGFAEGKGLIYFDADGYGFTVSNNGPPIPERDTEAVFEMGFTRKPGGRGLGLHISRQVLKEQGMELEIIPPKKGFNVTFRVTYKKGDANEQIS
ncbi:MAG: ATP-binding protein [Deltaproteobacteria bacterium]|nr:ATP-binding protein [Deltaproteobacteria bacterium]